MNDDNVLNNSNFLLYAAKYYDNPGCYGTPEFIEDLRRFKYIKKLITRYISTGELKERLILNHIIVLNNIFGAKALCRMLWLKMSEEQLKYVKPFLLLLDILPKHILNVDGKKVIYTDDVPMDTGIIEALRKL